MPVVLCGGAGTRLWPLSRKSLPKQFTPLIGEKSLFEGTLKRVDNNSFGETIAVTSTDYRFFAEKQMQDCGCSGRILLEPSGKNTAPAVFAAAHHVMKHNDDALLLIMPSDHHIPNQHDFEKIVLAGYEAAETGAIVIFGVTPDRPATGYGYMELGQPVAGAAFNVKKFHEKPDLATAQKMLKVGNHMWNAGIFLCRASVLLTHASRYEPVMLSQVRLAVDSAREDQNFLHIDDAAWEKIQGQSLDYAILEKTDQIACVKFSSDWSDLGDWNALSEQLPDDGEGNVSSGAVTQIDCQNAVLWSESQSTHLVGFGLQNIVTIVMNDAVLVADASRMQDIRDVVDQLGAAGISQAERHFRDYRPWGWFESLIILPGYQVKRLYVLPGEALSLQSHKHRSEHWVVVSGTASVVRDDEALVVKSNESVYIQAGQKHRLANETAVPLTVIEVQTGDYLGEDDIVRYDDMYSR